MKTEFENIEQAIAMLEDDTENRVTTYESIDELLEDNGYSTEDENGILDHFKKEIVSDGMNVLEFFMRNRGKPIYELSSNGSGECEFTTSVDDVYYFVNNCMA